MRFRTTLVLFVFLLGVGAFYYYEAKRPSKPGKGLKPLYALNIEDLAKDLDEITMWKGQEVIHLKRDGEGWKLLRPVVAKADRTNVELIPTTLAGTWIQQVIEEEPSDLAQFGLDRPSIRVDLKLKDGRPLPSLFIGDQSPTREMVYARLGDAPQVYIVSDVLKNTLMGKSVYDFRDKTVLAFDVNRVEQLEFVTPSSSIVLVKRGGEWRLVEPVRARADGSEVTLLLYRLHKAMVKQFVAETADQLQLYGLDQPDLKLGLWEGGAKAPKILLLARAPGKSGQPAQVYAKADPGQSIFLVEAKLLEDLAKKPSELRDRVLLDIKPWKAKRVRLWLNGGSLVLERRGERWRLREPEEGWVDEQQVETLLQRFTDLRFQEVVAAGPKDLRPYGLDKPQFEVAMWREDGSQLPSLAIGKREKDHYYAKLHGLAEVYRLEARLVEALPQDRATLVRLLTQSP